MGERLAAVALCVVFGGCTSVVQTRTVSAGTLRDAMQALREQNEVEVVDSHGDAFSLARVDRVLLDDALAATMPADPALRVSSTTSRPGSVSVQHFFDVCGLAWRGPCASTSRGVFDVQTEETEAPRASWGYVAMLALSALEGAALFCTAGELGCRDLGTEFRIASGTLLIGLPIALITVALAQGAGSWAAFN